MLRLKVGGGSSASAEFHRVAVSSKKLERQVDDTAAATERADKRGQGMRNVLGQIRGMARLAGPALLQMGMQGVSAGLKYNAVLESANTAFTSFLGSSEKAEKLTAQLAATSSKSPLPVESYMNSAKHMLGFGVAARDVVPYLQSINKAAVVTGSGGAGMEQIAIALGQIKAKGKLTADGLRALKAAGVPANKILQKEFGLTGRQIRGIGGEGIKADRAIRAITRGWEKQFGPAYQKASKTFEFQWPIIKKQLEKFLGEGLEPVITFLEQKALPAGRRFLAWLNRLPNSTKSLIMGGAVIGALALFGGSLGLIVGGIIAVGVVAVKYRRQIGSFIGTIVGAVTGAVKAVGQWISTAAKNVKGFIGDLLPVRLLITRLRLQFMILKPIAIGVFKALREHVKFMVAVFKIGFSALKIQIRTAWEVIKRLGAIVGNVVAIISNLLRGDWRGAWNAAKRLVANVFGIIKAVARGAVTYIKTIPRQILSLFKSLPGRVSTAVSGLFNGIKTAFTNVLDWVINKWNGFLAFLRGVEIDLPLAGSIRIPGIPKDLPPASNLKSPVKSSAMLPTGDVQLDKAGLPEGTNLMPTDKAGGGSCCGPVEVKVFLDSRQIALAVAEVVEDEAARL